jgi:hypothetical protein
MGMLVGLMRRRGTVHLSMRALPANALPLANGVRR